MNKIILSFVVCFLAIGVSNAQFTKIGGGPVYGSGTYFHNYTGDEFFKTGNPALNLKSIYEISVPIHISPSVFLFLPRVTEFGNQVKYTISSFMFDLNGHYIFNSLSRFEFYGLTGLNISYIKHKMDNYSDDMHEKSDETALGLNLGAGTYMKISNQLELFGEAKYIIGSRDQLVITAGVLLNLDWLRKHETRAF